VLDCKACGMEVHWVQGISIADAPHWGIGTLRAVLVGMLREAEHGGR